MLSLLLVSGLASLAQARGKMTHREMPSPLLTDINIISRHWGQLSPYADNAEEAFGVEKVGLPDGCGIEQVHVLQRHAQRFPTSAYDDGRNNEDFAARVAGWTAAANNGSQSFIGSLAFLNTYRYVLAEGVLTNIGAATEFQAGAAFWNRYGRLLYDAAPGQVAYNASLPDGTGRPRPVLRTTGQSRIQNSQVNWALGFFGPSFRAAADPGLTGWTAPFDVVVVPEGGTENNTLASYDSCPNAGASPVADMGDVALEAFLPRYLAAATARLQAFAPAGFVLTVNDTYAMQSLCAYETAYLGESAFCGLFTRAEWAGFERSLDAEYYFDYAWGNPTGRAQGLGYLQELLARLTNQHLGSGADSSVNATLDASDASFPLGRPLYADFSHDDIIISTLTAMSLDYFKDPPDLLTTDWPLRSLGEDDTDNGRFVLSRLTPFGARLTTEVIGCAASDPAERADHATVYARGANGYRAGAAKSKFVRLRLNNGILPLETIRGGRCAGRMDGMCALADFVDSQAGAATLANYRYACFGTYEVEKGTSGRDYDGTIFAGSHGGRR
ncbi:hypothetical protein P8C59_004512 [Phyllachora maydis]|uniref:Uncharacterized protein n=1 Tax=Phyllachora maydis TaxID=1825666 RepID=A0AAD9I2W1_9PEZI|nr:hypothetical protein P8C59_004512 [Phyllachora maydis]